MFLRFKRRTKVEALKQGFTAVVEGEVVAKSQLTLPGTKTSCVFYDVLNESYQRGARGAGRKFWMPTSADQKLTGFYIKDETGQVWVSAEGHEVTLKGAPGEAGVLGKGNKRYSARLIKAGFIVRAKGLIDEPKRGEPRKGLVLRPDPSGQLTLLVRKAEA